jgi:uncharacterized membrane protein YsdA (DUF1294 family)
MYNIYHIILAFIVGGGLGKFVSFLACKHAAKKKGFDLGWKETAFWWIRSK